MLHLASHGDPVRLNRAAGAAREAPEGAAHVVGLDRAAPAASVRPSADDRGAVAEHFGDRAEQVFRGGERVAADIGERAAAHRIVAEAEGRSRVSHVVLGVNAAIAADLAELARREGVSGLDEKASRNAD